tara:strand:- start:178 stop:357 length:180 start_codon:yes stop_codon:yes gene_type:complete
MKISLFLFILGILSITSGYAKQMKPSCKKGLNIKYIPRNVYDEMMTGKAYTEKENESLT